MKLIAALLLVAQAQAQTAPTTPAEPQRKVIGTLPDEAKAEPPPSPPDAVSEYAPDPATQLTIDLAEAHGSTLRELALVADDSVQGYELAAAKKALEKTGLFVVVGIDVAQATIQLRRLSAGEILATLTARQGERLWVKAIKWPKEAGEKARLDEEERFSRLRKYGRERLALRPVMQSPVGPSTIYYGGYQAPQGFADPSWGWGNGMMGGTPIQGQKAGDWVVVRGAADIVDEIELARMLGNRALEERVREARFKPKLWWGLGFGVGAVGGIASGLVLYDDKYNNDTRAIGFSLLGLGVASAIMALLTPTIGNGNKLTANETDELIADYNHGLREDLKLSPADTQKLDL